MHWYLDGSGVLGGVLNDGSLRGTLQGIYDDVLQLERHRE
jgi:hypothetical protein